MKVARINYHIIKKIGNSPHNPEEHNRSKRHIELKDQQIRVIGFFSKHHEGVFTHHGKYLHLHFISKDQRHSGHIEDLEASKDSPIVLKIQGEKL